MTVYNASPIVMGFDSVTTFSTQTLGANDPEVGAVYRQGNNTYMMVYNACGENVAIGEAVTVSGTSGYSVFVTTTTSADLLLGVRQGKTLSTGYYGFVQTRGFGYVKMGADFSATTGSPLVVAATGRFDRASNATGLLANITCKAIEGIASGTTGMALFNTGW